MKTFRLIWAWALLLSRAVILGSVQDPANSHRTHEPFIGRAALLRRRNIEAEQQLRPTQLRGRLIKGEHDPTSPLSFVRVSGRDPRYFELSNGQAYIPIGLNMIAPPSPGGWEAMVKWLSELESHGGNFIRIWLSSPFFDIEHQKSGEYDPEKAGRIDQLLAEARKRNMRVKLCLEHFRNLDEQKPGWSSKPLHLVSRDGTATNIADFFNGERSRARFRAKLDWFANRFGSDPVVFGWELWNEINAVQGGDYMAWTESMLPELRRLFPRNLAMQSLGSYDTERVTSLYRRLALLPGNDVAQVHRYLDLGARLEVCKGPVDELAVDAVRTLLAVNPGKPVLLAESGAVEPSHTGPFKLYAKDTNGMLLHDVLFAPFFSGAAGPGHIWHWDAYVGKNKLWWHFGRFAQTVKDLDPPAEHFQPFYQETDRLRVYGLKGRTTILIWCRDRLNDWRSELLNGAAPMPVRHEALRLDQVLPDHQFRNHKMEFYDPWTDQWRPGGTPRSTTTLPDFKRSLVVKIVRVISA